MNRAKLKKLMYIFLEFVSQTTMYVGVLVDIMASYNNTEIMLSSESHWKVYDI